MFSKRKVVNLCDVQSYKRTLTKTRMFVDADGQTVTTTTSTVVITGEENKKLAEHEQRWDFSIL